MKKIEAIFPEELVKLFPVEVIEELLTRILRLLEENKNKLVSYKTVILTPEGKRIKVSIINRKQVIALLDLLLEDD